MPRCSRIASANMATILPTRCAPMKPRAAIAPSARNRLRASRAASIPSPDRRHSSATWRCGSRAGKSYAAATTGSILGVRPNIFSAHLNGAIMLFPATVAGSLPKPSWLAEPDKLWPQWKLSGDELAAAKLDATLLAIKLQEDAGIDIVSDGEMARQHFVHGFLEYVDGIDFAQKVEMGIRAERYKAMVPIVRGPLALKGRVHRTEARHARAHTKKKLKMTLPGPMTIADTIADAHYGDKVKMAFAFADLLNQEARALQANGVDVIQF